MLRMYHANITQNHRVRKPSKIVMPAIVSRAELIVAQRRLLPIESKKVST
jgi:hypothetical protein